MKLVWMELPALPFLKMGEITFVNLTPEDLGMERIAIEDIRVKCVLRTADPVVLPQRTKSILKYQS